MKKQEKINQSAFNLAWRLRDVASASGALTGAFVIWSITYGKLLSAFGSAIPAFVVSAIVCVVVLFVIDYGLRTFFPALLESGDALKGNGWRGPVFMLLMLCVVGFQVVSTTSLSWNSATDVVDAVYEEPETVDAAGTYATLTGAQAAKVAQLEKRAKEIESSIKAEEKKVDAANPKLKQMIKEGNGWAPGELAKRKSKATRSMREELTQTHKLTTQVLSEDQKMIETVVAQQTQLNTSRINRYEETRSRNTNYVGYFGVSCTILFLLLSVLLHVWPDGKETAPRYDASRMPGVIPVSDMRGGDPTTAHLATVLSRLERKMSEPVESPHTVTHTTDTGAHTVEWKEPKYVVPQDTQHTHSTTLLDVENLKKATREQWMRAQTSKAQETRNENKMKADAGMKELKKLGYTIEAEEGKRLKIYVA